MTEWFTKVHHLVGGCWERRRRYDDSHHVLGGGGGGGKEKTLHLMCIINIGIVLFQRKERWWLGQNHIRIPAIKNPHQDLQLTTL